jgi:hypothetical protein
MPPRIILLLPDVGDHHIFILDQILHPQIQGFRAAAHTEETNTCPCRIPDASWRRLAQASLLQTEKRIQGHRDFRSRNVGSTFLQTTPEQCHLLIPPAVKD